MFKITVTIKEEKEKGCCNVLAQPQKDLSKATENEKRVSAMVFNEISNSIKKLEKGEN